MDNEYTRTRRRMMIQLTIASKKMAKSFFPIETDLLDEVNWIE
jgi:hypothetical protein